MAARAILMAGVLTGCSSVPDAVNPVEWYKGASNLFTSKDKPEVAAARPRQGDAATAEVKEDAAKKDPAKGLVADRGNANYAQSVRREVTPTKPLARRATPAADPQVATQPGAAPVKEVAPKAAPGPDARAPATAPAIAKSDLPPAPASAAPARTATERDTGPAAPPAVAMDNTPPVRPDIPETVAMPGQKLKPVQAHYQKRLAESASTVVRPDVVDFSPRATLAADEPIHLVPPPSHQRKAAGGRFVAAPEPQAGPAASFQVASVDFRSGSAELTREDRQAVAEVARLYRQSGGVIRVAAISHDGAMGGMDRANAVAQELSRRGVPGSKIMVGADPTPASGPGAAIFLDVM